MSLASATNMRTYNSRPDLERDRMMSDIRPRHSRKFAQGSREWFEACDRAFQKAMLKAMLSEYGYGKRSS